MRLPATRFRLATAPGILLLLTLLAALLVAACGGGDDDDGGDGGSAEPTSTTASGTPEPTKDSDSGSGGTTPTNTDREYAKQLCVSLNSYLDAFLRETSKDAELLSDEAKMLKVAAPILADLGDDLAKAKPPKDVEKYHNELVKQVKEVAQRAKDGKITTLQEISDVTSGVEEPPASVQARLQAASNEVKECQESALGGTLFGGGE